MWKLVPDDVIESRCPSGNIIYDPVTSEVICSDTGEVLADRLPIEIPESPFMSLTRLQNDDSVATRSPAKTKGEKPRIGERLELAVWECLQHGMTTKEIARKLGIPIRKAYKVVYKVRKKYGIRTPNRVPDNVKIAIAREYAAGVSVKDIIRKYGISTRTLYSIIKSRRVKRKRSKRNITI